MSMSKEDNEKFLRGMRKMGIKGEDASIGLD